MRTGTKTARADKGEPRLTNSRGQALKGECSVIIVAAKTATLARKEALRDKAMVRRNGEDICSECNEREKRR